MDISELAVRLLLLFTPGILWSYTLELYTTRREDRPLFFAIQSLLFGLLCYSVLEGIFRIYSCMSSDHTFNYLTSAAPNIHNGTVFFRALLDANTPLSVKEIVYACALALPLGLCNCYLYNNKITIDLARKIGITKKFGDEDVWSYCLNSNSVDPWVYIRDIENNLVYRGYVQSFSDDKHELFLTNVLVFTNDTGEELYPIPALYLSLKTEGISIEFPQLADQIDAQKEKASND